jgi:uncharacterized protein YutE (UPF0331/DUF86 family)/predicted nucleotidyltransferase
MIVEELSEKLKDIFVQHGVVLAYLFGSQAEGTARPSSDADFAVLLPPETQRSKYFDVRLSLTNALMDALHKNEVDVIVLNEATPLLAYEVATHGKILYEDEITRPAVDFSVYAASRYSDTAHFRRLAWEYLSEAIEQNRPQSTARIIRERKTIKLEVVQRLLVSLHEKVELLRPLQHVSLKELTADPLRWNGTLHLLQLSIEHVTDIGAHLLAGRGLAVPDDYRQIILKLGEGAGPLPFEFAQRIAPMAGFRNIVVHRYLTVDPERVSDLLYYHLSDFDEFIRYAYDDLRHQGYLPSQEKTE